MGNLNLPQVAAAQNQKEVTINQAGNALDLALTAAYAVNLAGSDVVLTNAQFQGAIMFTASGNAVVRALTVPAIARLFAVNNTGAAILTITRGSTTVPLAAGALAIYYTDGTADGLVTAADGSAGAAAVPVDVGLWIAGKPATSEKLLRLDFARTVAFVAGLTGSRAVAVAASTGTAVIDIQKNGASVGTITFTTSATGVLAMASPQSFAAGDILGLVAPGSQDATLADISITLAGTR